MNQIDKTSLHVIAKSKITQRAHMNILETGCFDVIIKSDIDLQPPPANNMLELLFYALPYRPESKDTIILLGHKNDNTTLVSIDLLQLRYIIIQLWKEITNLGLKASDTVLLTNLQGANELYTILFFIALSSYGIRVLLPFYLETDQLEKWLDWANVRAIFCSADEVLSLTSHDREKAVVNKIKSIVKNKSEVLFWDILKNSSIHKYILNAQRHLTDADQKLIQIQNNYFCNNDPDALILTTSGSSGISKLILYKHNALMLRCMSYQQCGLMSKDKLGGVAFKPYFAQVGGIIAFFNSLWSGSAYCVINFPLFLIDQPETFCYFLKQMKPDYVYAGPATFGILLELARNFPDLKNSTLTKIKTFLNAGLEPTKELAAKIKSLTGKKLWNQLAMTETWMIASTLLANDDHPEISIGLPPPGMILGLKQWQTDYDYDFELDVEKKQKLYQLYVKSPAMSYAIISEEANQTSIKLTTEDYHGFFATGDIVTISNEGYLFYVGREKTDFIKDGHGFKIPLKLLHSYYQELKKHLIHIQFYPINTGLGIAALLFLQPDDQQKNEREYLADYKYKIQTINMELKHQLEPFEFDHIHIRRFAIVLLDHNKLETNYKGIISPNTIKKRYSKIIRDLCDFNAATAEDTSELTNIGGYEEYVNSYVATILQILGIDYHYHSGSGDTLYTFCHGNEQSILDLVGSYGTNLLGHNNAELKNSLIEYLNSMAIPLGDQGSIKLYESRLAHKLSQLVGQYTGAAYNVCFGSTGAEVVEMALHHAMLEWQNSIEKIQDNIIKLLSINNNILAYQAYQHNVQVIQHARVTVIALKSAFHGHTSGARAILGDSEKRKPFGPMLAINTLFLNDQDNYPTLIADYIEKHAVILQTVEKDKTTGKLAIAELKISPIIAAIAEPVVSEGGVRVVDSKYLRYLATLPYPLIIDEIQSGLGRTGHLLASNASQVKGDYYLFSKALGGNLVKISALLIDKQHWQKKFLKYYSSTFAGGGMASHVATRVLDIIVRDNIPQLTATKGTRIFAALQNIQKLFPGVIKKIDGKGLLLGIHFEDFREQDNITLRMLFSLKFTGYVFSGYLHKKHNIRSFPSLSSPNVLRIEPSAYIKETEINHLINGFTDLTKVLYQKSSYELCKYLMEDDIFTDNRNQYIGNIPKLLEPASPHAVKVAFISHFVSASRSLRMIDDLYHGSDTGLNMLLRKMQILADLKPTLLYTKNLFGGKINLQFIWIPADTAYIESLYRKRKIKKIIHATQKAVDLAASLGAKIIGLGGYTSIATHNGLMLLEPESSRIVTGNTLTVAAGIKKFIQAIERDNRFSDQNQNCLGIVGALGNIGSAIANGFIEYTNNFAKIILITRPGEENKKRQQQFYDEIKSRSKIAIEITDDLFNLQQCNIISIATNTSDPIIFPHHLATEKPVLISDLSVPSAIAKTVVNMANVTLIPFAAFINLPHDPGFHFAPDLPQGAIYSCVAETILMGLQESKYPLRGKINYKAVLELTMLAEKFGFFKEILPGKSFKSNEG